MFFLYNDGGIQWTTGDDAGGINGLGGNEAVVGISDGDGDNVFTMPESGSPCILNVDKTSNVGIPGVWMFKVGKGTQKCSIYMYVCTVYVCMYVHTYVCAYTYFIKII